MEGAELEVAWLLQLQRLRPLLPPPLLSFELMHRMAVLSLETNVGLQFVVVGRLLVVGVMNLVVALLEDTVGQNLGNGMTGLGKKSPVVPVDTLCKAKKCSLFTSEFCIEQGKIDNSQLVANFFQKILKNYDFQKIP